MCCLDAGWQGHRSKPAFTCFLSPLPAPASPLCSRPSQPGQQRKNTPHHRLNVLGLPQFSPPNLAITAPRQAGLTPVVSLSSENACNTTLTSELLPKKGLGARMGDTGCESHTFLSCLPSMPTCTQPCPLKHFSYNYIVLQRGRGF